ncbi:MAG: hypothetical protein QM820_25275 [Minicystis sp.]
MLASPKADLRAAAALALMALAAAACDDESGPAPPPSEERIVAKLSFDDFAYVDSAISTRKLLERVHRENESIFSTLRRADVMITARKLVDVDLAHLEKEPVTVVDLDTGITRNAIRVRHHFVALALVPRSLAAKREVLLGALHLPTPAHPDEVLAACTANGEREHAAVNELWTVFDARVDACQAALAREQAAIDAARKRLTSPDREIVSVEFERLLVPVVVRLVARQDPEGEPVEGEHVDGHVKTPSGLGAPGDGPGAEPKPAWVWADRARERDFEDTEDEKELQRLSRPAAGGMGHQNAPRSWGSAVYMQPNFGFLAIILIALAVLIGGTWRQQRGKR